MQSANFAWVEEPQGKVEQVLFTVSVQPVEGPQRGQTQQRRDSQQRISRVATPIGLYGGNILVGILQSLFTGYNIQFIQHEHRNSAMRNTCRIALTASGMP